MGAPSTAVDQFGAQILRLLHLLPSPRGRDIDRGQRRVHGTSDGGQHEQARADGYEHVIDLSRESLKDGVLRITGGKGVDIVVDGVSGKLTGQALASLAFGGTIVVAGYAGGREAEVNVTDIIWKAATIRGFTFRLFAAETIGEANKAILGYLNEGALNPKVGKVFPLTEAAEAVRYLVENRPYGRIIMQVPHPAHAE